MRSGTVSRRALLLGAAAAVVAPAPPERYLFHLDPITLREGLPRFLQGHSLGVVDEPMFHLPDGNVRWHFHVRAVFE